MSGARWMSGRAVGRTDGTQLTVVPWRNSKKSTARTVSLTRWVSATRKMVEAVSVIEEWWKRGMRWNTGIR